MATLTLILSKKAQLQHGVSGADDINVSGANAVPLAIVNVDPALGDVLRHVMTFDLATLPANAVVTAAVVNLYDYEFSGPTGVTFRIHKITQAWVEAQVTWNSYSPGNSWATAGGDFDSANVEDTTPASSVSGLANTLDVLALFDWDNDTIADMMVKFATELEPLATDTEAHWDDAGANKPAELVITYANIPIVGALWVEGDDLHYGDENGVERVTTNKVIDTANRAAIINWLG